MKKILAKKPTLVLLAFLATVGLYTTATNLFELVWREGRVYRVVETYDYTNGITLFDGKYDNRRLLVLQELQTGSTLNLDVPLARAPYEGRRVTMRYGMVYPLEK